MAAIFAIGKPVAFDASADDRDTRGFISITVMRPLAGFTANWMFDSAGLDTDAPDDAARRVAHPLVFLVAEREDRRDGDAVAGVDAHRVDVLDRADDDEVVGDVAHHLELELFPADHRLLDQDLVHRAHLEAALDQVAELFDVVGDAAADAAHGERRTDHQREAERVRQLDRFRQRARQAALRDVEPISRIASLNSCRSSATLIA